MIPAGILHKKPHPLWDSRRLWSLWDMIDMNLGIFLHALTGLEAARVKAAIDASDEFPGDGAIKSLHNDLMALKLTAERLAMPTVLTRIGKIEAYFNEGARSTNGQLIHELEELSDAIRHDANDEYFAHYPHNAAKLALGLLRGTDLEWKDIVSAFPSTKREIEAAVDCFAFGDNPGCIFHITRVAELGLRAIAKERGAKIVRKDKPIEFAMWGEVIAVLQTKIEDLRTARGNKKPLTLKRREAREKAVEYYSAIMADMQALLPLRDKNAHFRGTYQNGQTFDALSRMKQMMAMIATKLGEKSTEKIKWGL